MINGVKTYGPLEPYEHSNRSQGGEDGIIAECFRRIGITTGNYLELGGGDGETFSNTYALSEKGWEGVLIEGSPELAAKINRSNCTTICDYVSDNLDAIVEGRKFNFVSIDIDGLDYYCWKAFTGTPEVVCIEYNPVTPYPLQRTIAFDTSHRFMETDYFGASLGLLEALGKDKGYSCVAVTHCLNMIFVRNDFIHLFATVDLSVVPEARGWAKDNRDLIDYIHTS